MADDPVEWESGSLTDAMKRIFAILDINPPPGGKFTSHSLRIGAHTEQVLVGIPLEVRMARFGWENSSQSMPSLYFDRAISVLAASFWFFGCHNAPASDSKARAET